MSERGQRFQEFFKTAVTELQRMAPVTGTVPANVKNWLMFDAEKPGFHVVPTHWSGLGFSWAFKGIGRFRVELAIQKEESWNDEFFEFLREHGAKIESELQLGEPLLWDPRPGRQRNIVAVEYPEPVRIDSLGQAEALALSHWAATTLVKWAEVFCPWIVAFDTPQKSRVR